jgi:hypothetical protein
LHRLITVEPLDKIGEQVAGMLEVDVFDDITLLPNPQTSLKYRERIKNIAAMFDKNFNEGRTEENARLVSEDVELDADGVISKGRQALINHFENLRKCFSDLLAHDEYVPADRHWASTEVIWQGTRNRSFMETNGTNVAPDGRM